MRKTHPLEYLAGRRKRRFRPKHPGEHKGTRRDRLELIRRGAEEHGRIIPMEDSARQPFAREMFDYLANHDLLYEAIQSLKGEASGADGIRPGDIGRYIGYRQWLVNTGLVGGKHPEFADTLFPIAPLGAVAALSACGKRPGPDDRIPPMFQGKAIYCDSLNDWYASQPADVLLGKDTAAVAAFISEARRRGLNPTLAKADTFTINHDVDRDLLRRAGVDIEALIEVSRRFKLGIAKLANRVRTAFGGRIYDLPVYSQVYSEPVKHSDEDGQREERDTPVKKHLAWNAVRWIADLLQKVDANGRGYKPRELRRLAIKKLGGGERVLSIPTAVDRIVSRTTAMLLGWMFDRVFWPCSVGCRLELDRFDALAGLHRHYAGAPGKRILCADIRKAFDNVPHDALLGVLRRYIGNPRMRILLERIVRRPGFEDGIGIPQGDPLSPLFLNLLLHEHLDKPLLAKLPENICYYRYVDDLCLFGLRSREEGLEYIETIQSLLAPITLSLHPIAEAGQRDIPAKTQIVDLAEAPAEWKHDVDGEYEVERYLGLGLRGGANGALDFFLTPSWRERVRTMFQEAEETIRREGYAGETGAHTHILHAAESWARAFSPAWTREQARTVPGEIVAIARDVSAHIGSLEAWKLARAWEKAHAWWLMKCRQAESVTSKTVFFNNSARRRKIV